MTTTYFVPGFPGDFVSQGCLLRLALHSPLWIIREGCLSSGTGPGRWAAQALRGPHVSLQALLALRWTGCSWLPEGTATKLGPLPVGVSPAV